MAGGGVGVGVKSRAFTIQLSTQCGVFSRVVMKGKSLSPLFPVGEFGGAVDTNDWCIKNL